LTGGGLPDRGQWLSISTSNFKFLSPSDEVATQALRATAFVRVKFKLISPASAKRGAKWFLNLKSRKSQCVIAGTARQRCVVDKLKSGPEKADVQPRKKTTLDSRLMRDHLVKHEREETGTPAS